MTAPSILELRDVHAAYGRIEVLRGVSFKVPKGSVVALLGPNGGGKTTTLKVASGQMAPTSGEVLLNGVPVGRDVGSDELARIGMCTVPEGRGIFPNLTVQENLRLGTFAGNISEQEMYEQAYARFPRLGERRKQLAGKMSGGEQQMLAMARALGSDPALLLLDELSMGLAPLIVSELYDVVGQLADEGVSILVIEQFARTAMAVADYVLVMLNGRITAVGEPSDLEDDIEAAYLGGAA
jgi:branched-chain amino acid transport system ATP-binding protein